MAEAMPSEETRPDPLTAALYIDFDNVFSSLRQVNATAAEKFAKNPDVWLRWFEDGSHQALSGKNEISASRRILVRRCYLNPAAFARYRPYFTWNGFSVIDCPSLTSTGKNSADIYMVMDIMDALTHQTRFDEFIILSSDADFTPVLLRLREHNRRSTIIANAVTVASLKASCDWLVPEIGFIEGALEIGEEGAPSSATAAATGADRIPESRRGQDHPLASPAKGSSVNNTTEGIRAALLGHVKSILYQSREPILLSNVGHKLPADLREQLKQFNWCGHGSMARMLKANEINTSLAVVLAGPKSYVFDPSRHQPLPQEDTAELSNVSQELALFIERANQVVGLPRLSPDQYAAVFDSILVAIASGFSGTYELSARTRDLCRERGHTIGRASIMFVLTGLSHIKFEFDNPPANAHSIAEAFRDNALHLCQNAQMPFTDQEPEMLDQWLVGRNPRRSSNPDRQ